MRFHLINLPHTETTKEYISCAYTQKVVKFAKMMKARGHEIVLYGGDANEAPCDEFVQIVSRREQRKWFGEKNLDAMYPITWNPNDVHWTTTNKRVIRHIKRGMRDGRYDKTDFLAIIAGNCNQQIDLALPQISAEYGVGYTGVFTYCAYESYSHQSNVLAKHDTDGRAFDTVIPNYFDLDEFPWDKIKNVKKGDHLLYVGRLILRKGLPVVLDVGTATGREVLFAGQGVTNFSNDAEDGRNFIETDDLKMEGNIRYIGTLDVERRWYEMARARAVLVPTSYVEPFGGVAVEAQLCGTPVITTDWGAFPETVVHGRTGFRCRVLSDYVKAVEDAPRLPRSGIRAHAEQYDMHALAPRFEQWFERLSTLWTDGWYKLPA